MQSRVLRILLVSLFVAGLAIAQMPSAALAQDEDIDGYFYLLVDPVGGTCVDAGGGNVQLMGAETPRLAYVPADNVVYFTTTSLPASGSFSIPAQGAPGAGASGSMLGAIDSQIALPPVSLVVSADLYVGGAYVGTTSWTATCAAIGATPAVTFSDTYHASPVPVPVPANIPGPDMVPISSDAVVGAFVATTPVYFAPELSALSDTVMEAGKTAWVYGVDASGAYYKVMLAGKFFWVPVSTMGPNYDEVWQGRALPTVVVE